MTRDWVASHMFPYLLLLAVLGIMLGAVASYLISFILAVYKISEILFMTLSVGGNAGG